MPKGAYRRLDWDSMERAVAGVLQTYEEQGVQIVEWDSFRLAVKELYVIMAEHQQGRNYGRGRNALNRLSAPISLYFKNHTNWKRGKQVYQRPVIWEDGTRDSVRDQRHVIRWVGSPTQTR